jgi:hypothetical protein
VSRGGAVEAVARALRHIDEEQGRLLAGVEDDGLRRAVSQMMDPALWASSSGADRAMLERVIRVIEPRGVEQIGYVHESLLDRDQRRAAGAHYTPRSLTEPIVRHALDPLVYLGPEEGLPREAWRIKRPDQILALRVCDPAMGAGAFLVQACRYLGEKVLEAWEAAGDRVGGHPEERLALARRRVAERCLYGVDRCPLAVEMAKASILLSTWQPGRPPVFLDHALFAGDSLLGLTGAARIRQWGVDAVLERAATLRRAIADRATETPGDAAQKARWLDEARAVTEEARAVADLVVGALLSTAAKGARERAATLAALSSLVGDAASRREEIRRISRSLLEEGRGPGGEERLPFHWAVEIPEVMAGGGFDAVVGNPPFRGGKLLRGTLGASFRAYLRAYLVEHVAGGVRGNADLSAYFLLRTTEILGEGGVFGLVATNTIAQGDTREVGLDQIVRRQGVSILRAVPSAPWPGVAGVEVAHLWGRRGPWRGERVIDGATVGQIGSSLGPDDPAEPPPARLSGNASRVFIGSYVLGTGFILSKEEAGALLDADPACAAVVLPYLNGEDVSRDPAQAPRRWIIDFRSLPLERRPGHQGPVAADFPVCLSIVRERVKPGRDRLGEKDDPSARDYARRWWQHGRRALDLHAAIAGRDSVIVAPVVSKYLMFEIVPARAVFMHKLAVLPEGTLDLLALLQSSVHEVWASRWCSTLRNAGLNYSPSDAFETFPFPASTASLGALGSRYRAHRQSIMCARREGLTRIYNRFHDPDERGADVQDLRDLHVQMDGAAAAAYGWDDLRPDHGFHGGRQGRRFTVSAAARREVERRLLAENRRRRAEETEPTSTAGK